MWKHIMHEREGFTMSKIRKVIVLLLATLLFSSFAATAMAATAAHTKTVTSSPITYKYTLTYTSYKDGTVGKVTGAKNLSIVYSKTSAVKTLVSGTAKVALVDSGRHYEVSSTVKYTDTKGIAHSSSSYVDFGYVA